MAIVGSESSGAQWFAGGNPNRGFKAPADEVRATTQPAVMTEARIYDARSPLLQIAGSGK